MSFALSTSWNAFRHTDGARMLGEIAELGFKEIELSFNLTPGMVSGITQAVGGKGMSVCSLHNFCPIPDGIEREEALPDCFNMASCDEAERRTAVSFTKRTIATAADLGARAVVLHCGRVEVPDKTRALVYLYQAGKKETQEFLTLREQMIGERSAHAQAFFDNACRSLDELSVYAAGKKIFLGVETRFYYREIPFFKEFGLIFKRFSGSPLRYWHDAGHAQLMEDLGIDRHRQYLYEYGRYLGGVHLHDIAGGKDHQAPSTGEMDFSILKPYMRADTIKVMEVHAPASADDVKRGRSYLEGIL